MQSAVKVSSRFQVVIPHDMRERLDIKPGDELWFCLIQGSLQVLKVRSKAELKEMLKGIDTKFVQRIEDRY